MKNRKNLRKIISIIFFVLILAFGIYKLISTRSASATWYNSSWMFRKKMVIDKTKVSGSADLTSFPVLVSTTDSDLKSYARQDGFDIMFTSSDGSTKLDHEIENYASASGTLVAWVRIPTLSYTTDTEIYMYYGNPSASNQANPVGVWDANYVAVYHLSETSGHHLDSKSTNNSTSETSLIAQGTATGKAGGADEFDGSLSVVALPVIALGGKDGTIEAWVKSDSTTGAKQGLARGSATQKVGINSNNYWSGKIGNVGVSQWVSAVTTTWHYLADTYDGTLGSNQDNLFVDGTQRSSGTDTANITIEDSIWQIGANGSSTQFWDGLIDEVRLSSSARSADWIATTYNTINSPSTFFKSTSSAQKGPTSPVLSWSFNEGYGTTAYDGSAYANSGTLSTASGPFWSIASNSASLNPADVGGSALRFNGTNNYVYRQYSNDTELDPGTAGFSISLWFNHPSTISGTDTLLVRYSGAGYKVYMNSSGYLCFAIDDDSTWGPDDETCTTTSYADSKWHHLEAVKTSTTTITVYVDGNQLANKGGIIATGSLSGTTPTIYLGIDSDSASNPWDGLIDEVRIFDSTQTQQQVKATYTAGGAIKGVSASFGNQDITKSLAQGLVGYWKMDEATWSGTLAEVIDSSGNGNHGQAAGATGGKAYPIGGKFGNSGYFDGGDDYVTATTFPASTANDILTYSVWFKSTGLDHSSGRLFSLASGGVEGMRVYTSSSGTVINADIDGSVLNTVQYTISTNTWYHLVVLMQTNNLQMYINGSLVASDMSVTKGPNDAGIYFGKSLTIGSRVYKGYLDDVRFYNRILSPVEVRALYDWAPPPVAYWKMDENTGTSAQDSSGNNKPLTLTSTTWTPGKFGPGLKYNGSTSTAIVTDGSSISLTNIGTIEAWVNSARQYPSDTGDTRFRQIINKWTGGSCSGNDEGYFLDWYGTNAAGTIRARICNGTTNEGVSLSTAFTPNTWYHIAYSWDGSYHRLYVNGQLATAPVAQTVNNQDDTSNLWVGDGFNGGYRWDGLIDDVKIYNYARTSKQIVQDMNAGHPAVGSPVGSALVHYKYDEGYGTTINNSGNFGSSINATSSGAFYNNDGKINKALYVNGSNYFASSAKTAFLAGNAVTYNSISFGTWARPTVSAASKTILIKNNEFRITTDSNSKPQCEIYSSSWQAAAVATTALPLESWSYILCTYDGISIKTYVNGALASGAQAQTGSLTSSSSTGLNIGWNGSGAYYFNGLIDDTKIYSYALSEGEVKLDYNQGMSTVLGALSTNPSDGKTASNSASASYCVPGDTTSCNSPVAEWKMDENSGIGTSAIKDTSGNGYSLTMHSSMTNQSWVPGKLGSGVYLNGTSSTMCVDANADGTCEDNDTLDRAKTINFWIKTTDSTGVIYDDFYSRTIPLAFQGFYIELSSGIVNVHIEDGSGAGWISVLGATAINNGNWHNVSIVLDATSANPGIVLDGKPDSTITSVAPVNSDSLPMYIGSAGGSSNYVSGTIDNISVYNYTRTLRQRLWDYNRGAPIALYKYDECQGTVAYNTAPTASGAVPGYNGTINIVAGSTISSAGVCNSGTASEMWNAGTNGKFNASYRLDGGDEYTNISDNDIFTFGDGTNDKPLTFSAWVKLDSDEINGGEVIDKYLNAVGDSRMEYRFYIDNSEAVNLELYDDSAVGAAIAKKTNNSVVASGLWYLLTATYDGTKVVNGIKIYINGVRSDTTNTSSGSYTAMENKTADVTFGARSISGSWSNELDGWIDDARIYNYALTEAQIKTLYNEDSAVRFAPLTGIPL